MGQVYVGSWKWLELFLRPGSGSCQLMTLEAEEIIKSYNLLWDMWESGPAWVSSYQKLLAVQAARLLSNATRRPALNCYDIFQHPSIRHTLAPPRTSCSYHAIRAYQILPFGIDYVSTSSHSTRPLLGRERPTIIFMDAVFRAPLAGDAPENSNSHWKMVRFWCSFSATF